MKNNSKGFSLVEMEMSLVVAAIIVLAIGSFAYISSGCYSNTKQESDLFSDISYTFRLFKINVRSAGSLTINANPGSPWASGYSVLIIGSNAYFGLYTNTTTNTQDVVYATGNINSPTIVSTGLKIYSGDVPLSKPLISCLTNPCTSVTMTLNGTQNKTSANGNIHQLNYNLTETMLQRV